MSITSQRTRQRRHKAALGLCLAAGTLWGMADASCALSKKAVAPAPSRVVFPPAPLLRHDAVYSASRSVTGLLRAPDGALWVATNGGVLCRSSQGVWRKWTRLEGLPSHEALGLSLNQGRVEVEFPGSTAVWDGKRWVTRVVALPSARPLAAATWRGALYTSTPEGLQCEGRPLALPPSSGTHVSALLPTPEELWAALYGDGLWSWNGTWQQGPPVPYTARDITALAGTPQDLWLGTRRHGVWHWDGRAWSSHIQPDEPFNANVQYIAHWNNVDWVATLEDGLAARTGTSGKGGETWLHWGREQLSSDAVRNLVPFQNALYVRHGGGQVDALSAVGWQRNVFATLPRHKVQSLASDGQQLYAAQWGGWSQWDGTSVGSAPRWQHHLTESALNNAPIMALLPQGKTLWIATQDRGVIGWENGQWRTVDERAGLPDDWVTALATLAPTQKQIESTAPLLAGTFVGGLAQCDAGKCEAAPELRGQNVTALQNDGRGGAFIATRQGLWYRADDAGLHRLQIAWLDSEVQALCRVSGGLWVGTRTSLNFVTDATLSQAMGAESPAASPVPQASALPSTRPTPIALTTPAATAPATAPSSSAKQ